MPDKDIMLQIRQHEEERPWAALDATGLGNDPSRLVEALAVLVEDWRVTADLYDRAKLKGAQSTYIVPLRHAAAELDKVIKGLEQQRRAPFGQLQPTNDASDQPFPPAECPAVALKHGHGAHVWIGGSISDDDGTEGNRRRPGHVENDRPQQGLDALIADSVAAAIPPSQPETMAEWEQALANVAAARPAFTRLVGEQGPELVNLPTSDEVPAMLASVPDDDVAAYLRGDTDTPPGTDPSPSTVTDQTKNELCIACEYSPAALPKLLCVDCSMLDDQTIAAMVKTGQDNRIIAMTMSARETGASMPEAQLPVHVTAPPVPLLGQPGDAGAGYDYTYVPPGGVPLTYAELMTPVPAALLPAHLSHSQIGTLGDCPTKYRAQRLERANGVPAVTEVPEWALIGGHTFHAIVEMLEQRWAQNPDASPPRDDEHSALWRSYFDDEIGKVEANSPVPRSRWRASRQGSEGETWWNANGPLMIGRYLAARPAEPTARIAGTSPNALAEPNPAIELELTVDVPTPYGPIPYHAVLDRVTVRIDANPAVAPVLVIRDYKTGATMPDTSQLGEYAQALRLLGVPPAVRILGTYFNARKGVWTPEVDLERGGWTAEWFSYHMASGYAQRLALTTGPTPARPSTFCGGCPVRWACPIKGAKVGTRS